MTITEFLLARIAEDEAVARAASIPAHDGPNAYKPHPELTRWQYEPWSPTTSGEVEYVQTAEMLSRKYNERIYVTMDSEGLSQSVGEDVGPHIARHDPARVLAECEAKRRIVDECQRVANGYGDTEGLALAVSALASVYADHADFDPAWRVAD